MILADFERDGVAAVWQGPFGSGGATEVVLRSGRRIGSARHFISEPGGWGSVVVSRFAPVDVSRFDELSVWVRAQTESDVEVGVALYFHGARYTQTNRTSLRDAYQKWTEIRVPLHPQAFRGDDNARFDRTRLDGIGIMQLGGGDLLFDDILVRRAGRYHQLNTAVPPVVYEATQDRVAPGFPVTITAMDRRGTPISDANDVVEVELGDALLVADESALPSGARQVGKALRLPLQQGRVTLWLRANARNGARLPIVAKSMTYRNVHGRGQALVRSGAGSDDELEFIRDMQVASSGMVRNQHHHLTSRSHLYTNALAALVFVHADELSRAKAIFDAIAPHQRSDGGFPNQFYAAETTSVDAGNVLTGNNAWYLLALTHYLQATGRPDSSPHLRIARRLARYLTSVAQAGNKRYGTFGGMRSKPLSDTIHRNLYVTEHQTSSFAALRAVASILESVGQAREAAFFRERARAVKDFAMRRLYEPVEGLFRTALTDKGSVNGRAVEGTASLDAQTWTFLAFASEVGIDLTTVLAWADKHMQSAGVVVGGQRVKGGVWFAGDRGIWLEGTAQLGVAFDFAGRGQFGRAEYRERSREIAQHMALMQRPNGGIQTFSDGYVAPKDEGSVAEEIHPAVITTAWRYFHLQQVNPFVLPPRGRRVARSQE